MDRFVRLSLLLFSVFYFIVCILAGLEVSHTLHAITVIFFFLFGFVVSVRYAVLITATILEKRKTAPSYKGELPYISIIVPAYNEEDVISAALNSLIKQEYASFEVIVVDDGSDDGTVRIANQVAEANANIPIRVIAQGNTGKSGALNTGIIHAQGDFIVCVDSDSKLDPDALAVGIQHFSDDAVGAIGGYVDVANQHKLLTRFQSLEYLIGLNFTRRGLSYFNAVIVVPGPIGMFRKEAILQVGGYNTEKDCFAEDAELTARLLRYGWKVNGETNMVAHTEAPETAFTLLRQRYRWKRGIFQACFENFAPLVAKPGIRGALIGAILAFESFVLDIVNFGITLFALASFLKFGEFKLLLIVFAFFNALDLIVLILATYGRGRFFQSLGLFTLQKLSYSYLLQAWGVMALFDEWLSAKMSWDKLERIGGESFSGKV
ncbi:MAG: glycosyltransferase [Methylococcaceae bacterium]